MFKIYTQLKKKLSVSVGQNGQRSEGVMSQQPIGKGKSRKKPCNSKMCRMCEPKRIELSVHDRKPYSFKIIRAQHFFPFFKPLMHEMHANGKKETTYFWKSRSMLNAAAVQKKRFDYYHECARCSGRISSSEQSFLCFQFVIVYVEVENEHSTGELKCWKHKIWAAKKSAPPQNNNDNICNCMWWVKRYDKLWITLRYYCVFVLSFICSFLCATLRCIRTAIQVVKSGLAGWRRQRGNSVFPVHQQISRTNGN